ncbi:tripartite tricarboxylate transporter substrate binding protein [Achromobacter spanius]|uniref:Bug family tripartite tricarboxylate transporter substrate binding protein n=1 Tax=Achromobacter spanius TaxID=217203 RepID=UPI003207A6E6
MKKRLMALLCCATAAAVPAAHAEARFPARAVTFVVPYPPGGPADLLARAVANKMSELAGQSVIVENRAGASGNIAGDYVARAAKDGYTLLFGSSPVLVINPGLYRNLKFDPLKDFEPIADFGSLPNAVLINQSLPVSSVQELIAYSRKDNATFASAGSGGTTHLAGLLFARSAGVPLTHIPYKGSAPALQALLGNQVTMTFTDVYTAFPYIEAQKLKVLGVTSASRSDLLPQVKTLQEQGMKDMDVNVFFALVAPKGIPEEARQRLEQLSRDVLADKAVRTQFQSRGLLLPQDPSGAALGRKMTAETATWKKLIQETGAAID